MSTLSLIFRYREHQGEVFSSEWELVELKKKRSNNLTDRFEKIVLQYPDRIAVKLETINSLTRS